MRAHPACRCSGDLGRRSARPQGSLREPAAPRDDWRTGTPTTDGWLTLFALGAAGYVYRDSVEIDEMKYPIRIDAQYIVPNSEGAGCFRGVPGAFVEYGPLAGEMEVVFLSDGTLNPARGVHGGLDGAPAQQYLRHADGSLSEPLGSYVRLTLAVGQTIVSYSCGGGRLRTPRSASSVESVRGRPRRMDHGCTRARCVQGRRRRRGGDR